MVASTGLTWTPPTSTWIPQIVVRICDAGTPRFQEQRLAVGAADDGGSGPEGDLGRVAEVVGGRVGHEDDVGRLESSGLTGATGLPVRKGSISTR